MRGGHSAAAQRNRKSANCICDECLAAQKWAHAHVHFGNQQGLQQHTAPNLPKAFSEDLRWRIVYHYVMNGMIQAYKDIYQTGPFRVCENCQTDTTYGNGESRNIYDKSLPSCITKRWLTRMFHVVLAYSYRPYVLLYKYVAYICLHTWFWVHVARPTCTSCVLW